MKVTIAQRKGNGDMVYTHIHPTAPNYTPNLHEVRIECHENNINHRTVSRFWLDSELEVWAFLHYMSGPATGIPVGTDHDLHIRTVEAKWRANNCEELYA